MAVVVESERRSRGFREGEYVQVSVDQPSSLQPPSLQVRHECSDASGRQGVIGGWTVTRVPGTTSPSGEKAKDAARSSASKEVT